MAVSRTSAFRGRARERQVLDGLLDRVRGGESAVLVIRGEAGIGKTALMHYCARQASGCRLVQLDGVEYEMGLPLAALHQLCTPMLSGLAALPEPQQRALEVAFGLATGPAPDRFVLGLAVLSLLAENAAARPLVCLVDDAQWLDEASSQVLGFVGRRLLAEPVGLLFAVREAAGERIFPGLPALAVEGLTDEDARVLLTAAVPGQLDERVRDRIVAETRGNPLGLLELARGMSEAELAGGFVGLPQASLPGHLQGHLQDHYLRRVRVLPGPAQQLMLLAAADPTGDATLLWRAAQTLGLGPDAAAAADEEQLLNIGSRVRFRHPLVRSAAYVAGSPEDRRAAHLTLATATDAHTDPERRVWHLAAAATEPDEDVATALEQAAAKIQARAGVAASAAFLQRSVALTAEPGRRTDRALAAALANLHAGAFDIAQGLLAQAEAHAVDDLQRARVEQLRGQIEWASVSGREAPVLLLQAAQRLESLDAQLARETYLHAWVASHLAGPLAGPGGLLLEVSRAAQAAPQPAAASRPCDLLLDGLTTMITQGRAAALPAIRRALSAFLGDQVSGEEWLQWGIFAQMAAMAAWDFDSWVALSARHVELARALGALAPLSIALNGRGSVATQCGDFETATSLAAEKDVVNEVTGIRLATTCDLLLAGYRGRPAEAAQLFMATTEESTARGEGLAVQMANWSAAVLHNGLGRYAEALAAAEPATEETYSPLSTQLILPELIEAAVRTGRADLARAALDRLSAMTVTEGSDWAKGLEARSRALVSEGQEADQCYAEAVERLGRTPLRPETARAHLLYGEWLRRENRRLDARHQLHAAYHLFTVIGADAFAERARSELLATGEKVRKREVDTYSQLTPQEEHIVRLARDGRTNPEIAAELFISTRTVEWHLRKVFAKLGIASRRDLHNVLPPQRQHMPSRLTENRRYRGLIADSWFHWGPRALLHACRPGFRTGSTHLTEGRSLGNTS
jgi:DNA-binding CsgD family transcriptional regulator